jgi:tRNA threonylcarbamoyladenosine biosynthesis protein TsaE
MLVSPLLAQPPRAAVWTLYAGRQESGPQSSASIVTGSPAFPLETVPLRSTSSSPPETFVLAAIVTRGVPAAPALPARASNVASPARTRTDQFYEDGVMSIATRSAAETEEVAASLAAELTVGDVVTVSGELGTGKTTFVRGACRALGVDAPVTSPTYTIGHRYRGRDGDVSHLDLYRFRDVSAAEWGDLEPYFDDAIVFVEWPEAGAGALPPPRFAVRIAYGEGDARIVEVAHADPGV